MITETLAGTELGPYRIKSLVGRGGMGVVYLAEHVGLSRRVALKVLAPELAQSESFRERFVRESRLAASIDHPNVIPIYDATEIDGVYLIAMRYVEGLDLKQLLQSKTHRILDVRRTVAITGQVASALDAAHVAGLVHRDVKPGNILIAANARHCYLTDFGLTKATTGSTGFTATGQFVGTTDYCAPEQIQGRQVDGRTDVYSLGCVVYECLTGSPPFARENDLAVMYAHMQDAPPAITSERGDLPRALDDVIATAMAKRKEDRYPSCSALVGAVRAALEVSTGRSMPPSPTVPERPNGTTIVPGLEASGAFTRPETEAPSFARAAETSNGYAPAGGPPPPTWQEAYQTERPEPRGGSLTAIAVVIAALLVAGGGTAAALIVTGGKDKSTTANNAVAPAPENPQPRTEPPSNPVVPETGPTPPPTVDTASAEDHARSAVDDHWAAIKARDYHKAYSYFTGPSAARSSEDGWVSSHEQDGIHTVDYSVGNAVVTGDSGTVTLDYARSTADSGDKCFSGTYGVQRVNGLWRISSARGIHEGC